MPNAYNVWYYFWYVADWFPYNEGIRGRQTAEHFDISIREMIELKEQFPQPAWVDWEYDVWTMPPDWPNPDPRPDDLDV